MDAAGDDLGRHPAGLFAALLATHAVGYEVDAVDRVDDVTIFVLGPRPLGGVTANAEYVISHSRVPHLPIAGVR